MGSAVALGILLALAGWGLHIKMKRDPVILASIPLEKQDDSSEDPQARLRRLVAGTWQDDYQGKRTMTLQPDGTGTMVVELNGFNAFLMGSRLRFDMTWSVEEGRLKKHTVGGEPAQKVQTILKMMGDRVDEPILELTEDRLRLLDGDGKTKYDWRRVQAAD